MFELMQRAGKAAFDVLLKQWPKAKNIIVLAGNGNNAGDGYVLATLCKQQGLKVVVMCRNPNRELTGDAKQAQLDWKNAKGDTSEFNCDSFEQADLLVDALLGTGVTGELKPYLKTIISQANQAATPILSIDLPSGMHANTGIALPVCINASVTVTFVATKPGLITGIGKEYSGKLVFTDLAIGNEFFNIGKNQGQIVTWEMLQPLAPRPIHSNKGSFGKLLCIGGNQNMPGAIRLSAEAALRSGAGLVKVFCHEKSSGNINIARPEIMTTHHNLEQQLAWCSSIAIGPGLGQDDWARQQFSHLLAYLKHHPKPLIMDADALNILASVNNDRDIIHTLIQLPALIFTPHPGEASRLLNCTIADIENDRYNASLNIAKNYQTCCVLKGAGTIIHSLKPLLSQHSWVCKGGNPGMATAGMGDVLTGVIGAFLAQGFSEQQAAIYGVCAHAEAGDRVAQLYGQRGMIATDLMQPLRTTINGL